MKNPIFAFALILTIHAHASDTISVNFHVGDDSDNQADHVLTTGETAGFGAFATDKWNNINIGNGAANASATIFPITALTDASGNASVATLSTSAQSTWFTGYSASSASNAAELGLAGNDDDLFNSYLGLNGPGGDGSPADSAVLVVSGLGSGYTANGYSLIIYSDSDKSSSASSRQSSFKLTPDAGSPTTLSSDDNNTFSGTYDNDASDGYSNYVVFENVSTTGFTLEITSPDSGRGAISGFQIVPNGVVSSLAINSFSVNDGYVGAGETATLSWDTTSATSLTISPGNINVTGTTSFPISPATTTTYTLTASDGTDSVTSDVEVFAGPARPNILLCLVDDWGVMDTSEPFSYDSYTDGAPAVVRAFNNFYQTPNLEQLADDGMKFSQAYALPVCSPTRTSLMTGFNAPRHAVTVHINLNGTYERPSGSNVSTHRSPNGWRYRGMEVTDVTLPRLLSEQGYRSIHAGKGHFGARGDDTSDPINIGFDINLGGSGAGSPGRYIGNPGYSSGSNPVPNITAYEGNGKWLTEALTEAMNDAMDDAVADGVPFFAYMSYYAVHSPFTTNPNATGDYSDAANNTHERFATMVEGVDTSLGQLRAHLEAMDPGVAENTLIIFLGDNGSDSPALNEDGQIQHAAFDDYPIRGKKANCYEGGYHVPLFVAWAKADPNNIFQQQMPINPNTVEHDIVSAVDIPTTILSVAGVSHPYMDGADLSPYLASTPGTHREQTLLRHQPNSQNSSFFTTYRRNDYKLIYFYYKDSATAFELYDLSVDRDESNNLASSNPELVLQLAREMAAALNEGWGEYGALWPTLAIDPNTGNSFSGDGDEFRPLNDDPFLIDFTANGYDLVDSDIDGLVDALEDADGNGLKGSGETSADLSDSDFDGSPDGLEVGTGTDPLDGSSSFVMQIDASTSDILDATWPSIPGRDFLVEGSDDMDQWDALDLSYPAEATGNTTSLSVELPEGADRYFIRITVNP
ncbi:MAG: sulfatase-like hydrolase/transferase [Luteolibacter sp.]